MKFEGLPHFSPESLSQLKYRPDIDGLRAVAVISAVIFHAFPEWMGGRGFVGPEVFFVISGFLISTIIFDRVRKNNFTLGEFYSRRIRRVFPALLVVLVFCYATGWFTLLGDDYKQLGKHIAAGAGFLSNIVLWHETGYFDSSAETKILLHLWTLAIEEQFYLIWPPLVWMVWKRKINLLLLTVSATAASFYFNIRLSAPHSAAAFYFPHTRFWELLSGGILAWCTVNSDVLSSRNNWLSSAQLLLLKHKKVASNSISWLGAILLAYGFYTIKTTFVFPGYWALIPVVATVLIIVAGADAWPNRVLLGNRLMVGMGLISYPFYLWHWPLLSFARVIEGSTPDKNLRIAIVSASLLLAWATYTFIETPIRRGRYPRGKTLTLSVVMLVIASLGYALHQSDGLEFRFPAAVQALSKPMDMHKWYRNMRLDKCYLLNPLELNHDKICYEQQRPLVGLWGDSHSAALYPGFKNIQAEKKFGIIQLTQAGCPPIFNLEKLTFRPNCNDINQAVLNDFVAAKPDVLILHSAWDHPFYPLTPQELYDKFSTTLKKIKSSLPSTRLIVIGPVPRWRDSPQKESFLYWQKSLDKIGSPPALQSALLLDDIDRLLARVAEENSVQYISAISVLCEKSRCVARVGTSTEDFTAIDYAHLSTSGAEFFVQKIQPGFFEK